MARVPKVTRKTNLPVAFSWKKCYLKMPPASDSCCCPAIVRTPYTLFLLIYKIMALDLKTVHHPRPTGSNRFHPFMCSVKTDQTSEICWHPRNPICVVLRCSPLRGGCMEWWSFTVILMTNSQQGHWGNHTCSSVFKSGRETGAGINYILIICPYMTRRQTYIKQ